LFIGFFLLTLQPFVIPLNGLSGGKTEFRWRAGGQFFSIFENSEILDADILIDAVVEKSGRYIGLDLKLEGKVFVECDRCLGKLELPVSVHPTFSIKFGEEGYCSDNVSDQFGREVIFLPEGDAEMVMDQIVYDYTCLSLPMSKCHPSGQCDPETVKFLSSENQIGNEDSEMQMSSPFAALKGMLK